MHAPVSEEEYDISSIACAFAEVHSYSAVNALNDIDGAAKVVTITQIKDAANHDQTYCELLQLCQSGFPRDSSQLTNALWPFWKIYKDLYIVDNLLMYGNRLVIPASLRKEVLECLHAAHQGVAGMKARAATCVYWPGISADISNRRIQCHTCNTIAPSQAKLPLQTPPAPIYPF